MIYKDLNLYDFQEEMKELTEFSYGALELLYTYLDEIDIDIEIDPVALRCEWAEYDSIETLIQDYSNLDLTSLEDFENRTTVLTDNSVILVHEF